MVVLDTWDNTSHISGPKTLVEGGCRRTKDYVPYSRWPSRPRCRCAGGSRACRRAPSQSRALPGSDPRRAATTSSPRCRSRGPLARKVPAVPPYPTPAPCPTRPTTLARRCSPGLGAPLVESVALQRAVASSVLGVWTMPPLPGAPDALPLGDVLDLAVASAPSRLPLR